MNALNAVQLATGNVFSLTAGLDRRDTFVHTFVHTLTSAHNSETYCDITAYNTLHLQDNLDVQNVYC